MQARVVDRREECDRVVVVGAALDRQGTLADLGEHDRHRQHVGGPVEQVESLQRSGGDDDRVEPGGLLEPGRDVAAQLREGEVRPVGGELRAAADGPGRDAGSGRQEVERCADQRISRVAAFGYGRDRQARSGRGGQILRRVDREVGAAVEHRLLDLLHEHAGATHGMNGSVDLLVTRRGDPYERGVSSQEFDDPFGLAQGERAGTRRHAPPPRHQSASSDERVSAGGSFTGAARPNSSASVSA